MLTFKPVCSLHLRKIPPCTNPAERSFTIGSPRKCKCESNVDVHVYIRVYVYTCVYLCLPMSVRTWSFFVMNVCECILTVLWFCCYSPSCTFSQIVSMNFPRSEREFSCQNPRACISSCRTIPLLLQPSPIDSSCAPGLWYWRPTRDQHLEIDR